MRQAGEIITIRAGEPTIRAIRVLTITLKIGEALTLTIINGEIITIIRVGGTIIHKTQRVITIIFSKVVRGEITLPISQITHGVIIKAHPGATRAILHGETQTTAIPTTTVISSLTSKKNLPTTTSTLTAIPLSRITTKTRTLH